MFRTLYNREGERFFSAPGEGVVPVYGYVKDKETGEQILQVIGKKDQYAEIQSYKDSVDLNLLLARFTNGDLGALNQREGFYGDVSELPSDYRSLLDVAQQVQLSFESLDPAEQAKFGDADTWLKALMSQTDTSGRKEDGPEPQSDISLGKEENSAEN